MSKAAFLFLMCSALLTIALTGMFGIAGLLTGLGLMWITKPLIEDMW